MGQLSSLTGMLFAGLMSQQCTATDIKQESLDYKNKANGKLDSCEVLQGSCSLALTSQQCTATNIKQESLNYKNKSYGKSYGHSAC